MKQPAMKRWTSERFEAEIQLQLRIAKGKQKRRESCADALAKAKALRTKQIEHEIKADKRQGKAA